MASCPPHFAELETSSPTEHDGYAPVTPRRAGHFSEASAHNATPVQCNMHASPSVQHADTDVRVGSHVDTAGVSARVPGAGESPATFSCLAHGESWDDIMCEECLRCRRRWLLSLAAPGGQRAKGLAWLLGVAPEPPPLATAGDDDLCECGYGAGDGFVCDNCSAKPKDDDEPIGLTLTDSAWRRAAEQELWRSRGPLLTNEEHTAIATMLSALTTGRS